MKNKDFEFCMTVNVSQEISQEQNPFRWIDKSGITFSNDIWRCGSEWTHCPVVNLRNIKGHNPFSDHFLTACFPYFPYFHHNTWGCLKHHAESLFTVWFCAYGRWSTVIPPRLTSPPPKKSSLRLWMETRDFHSLSKLWDTCLSPLSPIILFSLYKCLYFLY